jgi:hypothetical protein
MCPKAKAFLLIANITLSCCLAPGCMSRIFVSTNHNSGAFFPSARSCLCRFLEISRAMSRRSQHPAFLTLQKCSVRTKQKPLAQRTSRANESHDALPIAVCLTLHGWGLAGLDSKLNILSFKMLRKHSTNTGNLYQFFEPLSL